MERPDKKAAKQSQARTASYLFERPIQKKEAMVDKVNILDYY
jgi:hypothetical protein